MTLAQLLLLRRAARPARAGLANGSPSGTTAELLALAALPVVG